MKKIMGLWEKELMKNILEQAVAIMILKVLFSIVLNLPEVLDFALMIFFIVETQVFIAIINFYEIDIKKEISYLTVMFVVLAIVYSIFYKETLGIAVAAVMAGSSILVIRNTATENKQ